MNKVISDPILKDYLEVIGIDVSEKDKKKLAKAISTLADSKFVLKNTNPLMLTDVSSQQSEEKEEEILRIEPPVSKVSLPASNIAEIAQSDEDMRLKSLKGKIRKAITGVSDTK